MTRDNSELAEIRGDIRLLKGMLRPDEHTELRDRVESWIARSHEQTDADTAEQYVDNKLTEMLAEYPMYHKADLSTPEKGFPDACHGCPHARSACPVLLDETEVRWRERLLDEADTEQEARRVYQRQAIDVGCKRIPEILEEWDTEFSDFIREGEALLDELEAVVWDRDDEDAPAEVPAGGGPA